VIDCDDAPGTEQPTPGEILAKVEPLPTESSRRARVTGIVKFKLRTSVGETGAVTALKVLEDVPFGLSKRAQEVVSTWRFAPAMRDGRAVSSVLCLASEFPGFEP
jgi:Gram-negative bacterial TonB protein C-terminal